MARYSHQYLVAVTVENAQKDPDWVSEGELAAALARRLSEVILHDGKEAFSFNDTEEI